MARYEVRAYIGLSAALKAERDAIEAEAPLLNVQHNKGRGLPRGKINDALGAAGKTLERRRELWAAAFAAKASA
jgi:hypothetical protein